jgi:hypothetical protein
LAVTVEQLEPLQRRPVYGPPYLVVLERFAPDSIADGTVVAVAGGVGEPPEEPSGYGPSELAYGAAETLEPAEPLFPATGSPGEGSQAGGSIGGDGWSVSADGDFFLLTLSGGGRGWRAGVGTPLWSDGRYLLARSQGSLLLYDFVPR